MKTEYDFELDALSAVSTKDLILMVRALSAPTLSLKERDAIVTRHDALSRLGLFAGVIRVFAGQGLLEASAKEANATQAAN